MTGSSSSYDARQPRHSMETQRSMTAAAVSLSSDAQTATGGGSQQQPVEFDHAIIYVNKIKVHCTHRCTCLLSTHCLRHYSC